MSKQSFFDFPEEFRTEALSLLGSVDISKLYLKENGNGEFQQLTFDSENVHVIIKQERMYINYMPHRTNCLGEIAVILEEKQGNYCEYIWSEFQKIINWTFPDRPFRIIVPNIILSEPLVKDFIRVALDFNLPVVSTNDEQITYYTELVDGSIDGALLLSTYPQIINESRPL